MLRRFGNMSSATILFVLKEIIAKPAKKSREPVLAMAFGPGLTAEMCIMSKLTASLAGAHSAVASSAVDRQ